MKKFLYTLTLVSFFGPLVKAQNTAPAPTTNFDKKIRFGLRVTPQPTWLTSGDKNNTANGAGFGFGFGLNMEFRFSDIASLLTGIGGDFDRGKYQLRNDPANNYEVRYWQDESGDFVQPADGKKSGNTIYYLKQRNIKSTYATIPIILKLSTKEYNGLKYYGMFGGEIGIRLKGTAQDTYSKYGRYDTSLVILSNVETTESSVNVTKELFPVRLAFNAGAGAEYRLGGSTSLFVSINYFRALTPYMYNESSYLYYREDISGGKSSYRFVKQALTLNAIKINIGIMF